MKTLLIICAAIVVAYAVGMRILKKTRPLSTPPLIGGLLDSRLRTTFYPPRVIIDRSGVRQGMRVLEIGCGSGAYTTTAARRATQTGGIVALDLKKGMIARLKGKLSRPENGDITNVSPVMADANYLPFRDGSFDLVLIVTVLQEIPTRAQVLAEARRVLLPGGVLAVTEHVVDPYYVSPRATRRLGTRAGFRVEATLGGFFNYTVRFVRRSDEPGR